VLNRALSEAAAAFDAGERDAGRLRGILRSRIEGEPLAAIDYVSVADDGSLEEIDGRIAGRAIASLAVRFGSTRLIDNVELG
jgi:pantoate--beta-alanine ligase